MRVPQPNFRGGLPFEWLPQLALDDADAGKSMALSAS